MNILALDTAGSLLSVSLCVNDSLVETSYNVGFRHAETLLPAINELFALANHSPSQVELVAYAKGPGSFTGLRIGISSAKAISLALGIPLVGVSTLRAYAESLRGVVAVTLVVLDARKGRFYAALYKDTIPVSDELDATYEEIEALCLAYDSVVVTGPGVGAFFAAAPITKKFIDDPNALSPKSRFLLALAEPALKRNGPDSDEAGPDYIRLSDARLSLKD